MFFVQTLSAERRSARAHAPPRGDLIDATVTARRRSRAPIDARVAIRASSSARDRARESFPPSSARAGPTTRARRRDVASRSDACPGRPVQILKSYKERFKFSRNDADSAAKTGHRPHMAILGTPLPNVVLS